MFACARDGSVVVERMHLLFPNLVVQTPCCLVPRSVLSGDFFLLGGSMGLNTREACDDGLVMIKRLAG